ncbi:hypothetical protein KMW28_12775 [Flammeovirga yaeyamensis]|uniref:Protein NO VEIN C-terminal domain-containing protein n=1 Tax=Flammeovirga yaeyamensis TaxID=367791 RepID=A0AAX1MZL2_9BACT|nr:hypothetical protein [Flammeovirga yaeyamensis]MBB3695957.1 hypothetical protein [Flammeovirga yaeyamensis]NMF34644.1 hypothetical protein [Flammeovirga yaeyamensis]QWG00527.1 hypothetical protein KMW28_12775 [Flammeovirga yaeyamensis]
MQTKLITDIFNRHHHYYMSVGAETISQQSGNIEQVIADYQGRVIYELLQNAFDKAEKNIKVIVEEDRLLIMNDGEKFTYNLNHDYAGKDDHLSSRCDFQSLCSISTSSKLTSENIGNKGVGFKSVFSITKDEKVNVHTQGIIKNGTKEIQSRVSFCLYDVFRTLNQIPKGFDSELLKVLAKQIDRLHKERADRGVPGYYYPIPIDLPSTDIDKYYGEGFVTIIEIPFANADQVNLLIDEIKNIHFNFVQLKYEKNFIIEFVPSEESSFQKNVGKSSNFFSTSVKGEKLNQLAKEAAVEIQGDQKIGIYFKSKEEIEEGKESYLYNYLPTQQNSFFKYVDFHADFHTSVDRKSIEFDEKTKIGRYNKALLRCCLEFYFQLIAQKAKIEGCDFHLQYLDNKIQDVKNLNFLWSHLLLNNTDDIKVPVREILGFNDTYVNGWNKDDRNKYVVITDIISDLAKENLNNDFERSHFLEAIIGFIHAFTFDRNTQHRRSEIFKKELAYKLKQKKVKLFPSIILVENKEILFNDSTKENIKIPQFVDATITSFRINDDVFRKALGVKEYNNPYEVLKYFRQVSIKGEISSELISEEQQIELIKSVYQFFKRKTDNIVSFVHRYKHYLDSNDRENNVIRNHAAFSVSTIYLKINDGTYLPAQLCQYKELDVQFLQRQLEVNEEQLKSFVMYLGVNTINSTIVCDGNLWKRKMLLNRKTDQLPKPVKQNAVEQMKSEDILPNIRYISKNNDVHPSLINYNNYSFFETVGNREIRKQLTPLKVGDYNSFPREFKQILFSFLTTSEKTKTNPGEVARFYTSNLFHAFNTKDFNQYLVVKNEQYKWVNDTNFHVAKNREDYHLYKKNADFDVLCFFNTKELSEGDPLKEKVLSVSLNAIEGKNEIDITSNFKSEYVNYVPFILLDISQSDTHISDRNYLINNHLIENLRSEWDELKIIEKEDLTARYNLLDKVIEVETDYLFDNKILYLDRSITNTKKAEAIAQHLFNLKGIKDRIELVFFNGNYEDILMQYDQEEINQIKKSWNNNYQEIENEFYSIILNDHEIKKLHSSWFVYNKDFQSELLIQRDKNNTLKDLENKIREVQIDSKFNELFGNFKLNIDRSHIVSMGTQVLSTLHDLKLDDEIEYVEKLTQKLGVELELRKLMSKYCVVNEKNEELEKELVQKNKIKDILDNYSKQKDRIVEDHLTLGTSNITQEVVSISNKKIFKGNSLRGQILEQMGVLGEETVLMYYIDEFLTLDVEEKKKGIEEVYQKSIKLGATLKESIKEECLTNINNTEVLREKLISLFYITMHHKFSYFDLLVYDNGTPTLIEVKKSSSGRDFFMSIAEVNAARANEHYEIVINSKNKLYFIGNPIKSIEEHISTIKSSSFSLTPRNYKIEIDKSVFTQNKE